MIIVLEPDVDNPDSIVDAATQIARRFENIDVMPHRYKGRRHQVTEIHLVGMTSRVPLELFAALPGVLRVIRVSTKYRLIGRHHHDTETVGFEYNGVSFKPETLNIVAGLCAVDTLKHVDQMMAALAHEGIVTTRMGAYKPRTSPYDFQGLGEKCLPWILESAGKHGIRVVAMEVLDVRHIDEIVLAREAAGNPTGIILQVGTRNAQNFELLKAVGQQGEFPALVKRGMGLTLEESLNACEYVASEGNPHIVFCLRGVKTNLGDPHRNLVDFAHVPVVLRQTRLPVCIDPSHSVGRLFVAPDGIPDIFHVIGQGIITGASMALIDFHPRPEVALCDGPQALTLDQLPRLLRYAETVRTAYNDVVEGFD